MSSCSKATHTGTLIKSEGSGTICPPFSAEIRLKPISEKVDFMYTKNLMVGGHVHRGPDPDCILRFPQTGDCLRNGCVDEIVTLVKFSQHAL